MSEGLISVTSLHENSSNLFLTIFIYLSYVDGLTSCFLNCKYKSEYFLKLILCSYIFFKTIQDIVRSGVTLPRTNNMFNIYYF
jgi:hypothetical protein